LGVLLAVTASAAAAAEKLLQGPAPAWVKPAAAVKAGPPAPDGPPVSYLRLDRQLNFGPDGDSAYQESVAQIRTTMGLSQAGTISLSWDPGRDTVTIHKLRIVREGQAIDVLARQSFTIIRREANLTEIVDGRLTATLQPEDLRVGDVLEMAYTQTHLDPVLQGRTEFDANLGGLRGVGAFSLRAVWPSSERIAWRAGTGLGKPKVTQRGGMTELSVELKDPAPLKGPSGAPRRYWPTRELEFSEFASWAEVAAQMTPHFEKASTLAADSPLKAEAAKIRALSGDPKVRAAAALKLVQDQVRYLGLILADGGYTPVDADKTWARRFGECKAKTVLLIALLRELEIEAEPALVNAFGGEGLDRQLPRMSAFNHVIVRATIGGKVYWMDGTRTGDAALDALRVPTHKWALPIRSQGSALVELVEPPRTAPDSETFIEVDATGGVEAPAPVRGEMIMRGDMGLWPGVMAANMPAADRDRMLKSMWAGHPGIEVKTATATRDPATGESRMLMTGVAKLRWFQAPNGARWLFVPQGSLGWRAEFKREPDEDAAAPFAVGYPSFVANRFAIKLPHRGEGFSAPAEDVDKTVAGRAFLRRTKIEGAVFTIETSVRAVAPEFPAAEAATAAEALTEMANARVVIQAPRIYHATDADVAAWLAETPKTANEYIDRGGKLARTGRLKDALADFEKAVAVDPKSSWAYANRGLARIQMGDFDLAKPDLDQAAKLEPRNAQVQNGLAALAMRDGRYADAAAAYTRAADLTPNNVFALAGRAEAHLRIGDTDKALADYAEILQMDPKMYQAHMGRSRIYGSRGDEEKSLAELDAAVKLAPGEPFIHTYRGAMLVKLGRREEGEKAFAQSLALKPTVEAYLTRAANRPKTDVKGRLADIAAGEKLDPTSPDVPRLRAQLHVDAGEPAKAIPILTRALQAEPKASNLLAARAEAYTKAGQTAPALKDFAELRTRAAGSAEALNNLCWTQATLGVALEAALDDCAAALKIAPNSPHIADSKGFVLLRLGRPKEAVAAYDEALGLRTQHPESLYGRGLAKLKLGMTAEGEADLAAALALRGDLGTEFAGYGVTR
jgi:tetratricopeptide (TPR) repeat protein/transglutaminase-like putative cysteine protease